MNSLSWFLYLAEVVTRVQFIGGFTAAIGGLATLFYFFAVGGAKSGDMEAKAISETIWMVPWITLLGLLLAVFTPSKETIYLIAGSEAGEAVVTSETGQEILNDIKEVI